MTVKGSSHCGATQFTVTKRPETVTRCTCSFCTKRGALWAYQDNEDDFVLITARDRVCWRISISARSRSRSLMARRYGETRSQEIAVDRLPVVPTRYNFASFINGP